MAIDSHINHKHTTREAEGFLNAVAGGVYNYHCTLNGTHNYSLTNYFLRSGIKMRSWVTSYLRLSQVTAFCEKTTLQLIRKY